MNNLIKSFLFFLSDIFKFKSIIFDLVKRDIQNRYLGSYLGFFWVFIQPLVTLILLWFVFTYGLRSKPIENFPFILWLMTALLPWNFCTESILSSANSIIENSFLVKKVLFRVSILPIVKLLSSCLVHSFFLVLLFLFYIFHGYSPDIYSIQILYYFFAAIFFLLSLSWITSSVVIFFRDFGQIISMSIQFGFWFTPIIWSPNMIPQKYNFILQLNPFYYITEGYRDSMIHKVWFWEKGMNGLYFWSMSFIFLLLGIFLFKKLRPHFADVL